MLQNGWAEFNLLVGVTISPIFDAFLTGFVSVCV